MFNTIKNRQETRENANYITFQLANALLISHAS